MKSEDRKRLLDLLKTWAPKIRPGGDRDIAAALMTVAKLDAVAGTMTGDQVIRFVLDDPAFVQALHARAKAVGMELVDGKWRPVPTED